MAPRGLRKQGYLQLKAELLGRPQGALLQLDRRTAPDLRALSQDLASGDPELCAACSRGACLLCQPPVTDAPAGSRPRRMARVPCCPRAGVWSWSHRWGGPLAAHSQTQRLTRPLDAESDTLGLVHTVTQLAAKAKDKVGLSSAGGLDCEARHTEEGAVCRRSSRPWPTPSCCRST